MAHSKTGVIQVELKLRDQMTVVFGRAHPTVEGLLGGRIAGENRFNLVPRFEGSPFHWKLVASLGGMPVRAVSVRVDMIKVSAAPHVLCAFAGTPRQLRIPVQGFPSLSGVATNQSGHFSLALRTTITRRWLRHHLLAAERLISAGSEKCETQKAARFEP